MKRLAILVTVFALAVTGCTARTTSHERPRTVRVPADATTAQRGADLLRPGDTLLLAPGTYREELVVGTRDVTIRGADRNKVIFDGQGKRQEGILVIADGVRVENLTVHSYLYNGVLITGLHDGKSGTAHGVSGYDKLNTNKYPPVQRYAVDHVTAYNNGLYGIYAFDAQHGVIESSYASGSADSGIYLGQCRHCDSIIRNNIAVGNAVGFENANASGPVTLIGNRFSRNRVGLTLTSNYQEAFTPQRDNIVVGNVITDNVNRQSPSQADGGYGTGIGIAGSIANTIRNNLISGNSRGGVLISNTEDLPAVDNRMAGNAFAHNGVDVANISNDRAAARGNCVESERPVNVSPSGLKTPDCASSTISAGTVPGVAAPPGVSFLALPKPPPQPQLFPGNRKSARLPSKLRHPNPTHVGVPAADLLSEPQRRK